MKLLRSLEAVADAPEGRSIALGTFDGVHRGHRAVIAAAVEHAAQSGQRSCVVTFDPHPAQVLRPDLPLKLLSTPDVKAARIAELGASELLAIPFTHEFADMTAERFCAEVIEARLGARFVSVGANFRFGHAAKGDVELLRSHGGFDTDIVGLVEREDGPISSTRIRELIESGAIAEANDLLGAPFLFEGEVVAGARRGRELGVPTANIVPAPDLVVPGKGVYAALAEVEDREIPAAINVGVRPTFEEGGQLLVEAHLIDYDDDIYGSVLRLSFLERLRDETRFESADELVAQMRRDLAAARTIGSAALQGVSAP